MCTNTKWRFEGERSGDKAEVNKRVAELEEKIRIYIDRVAPMAVKNLVNRKPNWLTQDLTMMMTNRDQQRRKARTTRERSDWDQAKKLRNTVNRMMKKAERSYLKKNLENWGANSRNGWAAVSEHLGWSKPCAPVKLIVNGRVITEQK